MKQILKITVAIMCVMLWQGCNTDEAEIDLTQTLIDGNKWTYYLKILPVNETHILIEEVRGDTIIEGVKYKKVYSYINDYEGIYNEAFEGCSYYREEGSKLYQYSNKDHGDVLAYNFGLKKNDKTTDCNSYGETATVKDVCRKKTQDGVKRKHLILNNTDTLVEGIGSLYSGLLVYQGPGCNKYGGFELHRLKQFESQGKVVYDTPLEGWK